MYHVTRWVMANAAAAAGFTEGQVDDIVRGRQLPQFVESEAGRLFADTPHRGPKFIERMVALKELAANYRELTADPADFAEVMTTSHFTAYMSDALSREFYRAFDYANSDLGRIIYNDTAPDFRAVKRYRMTELDDLTRRGEKEMHRETSMQTAGPDTMAVDEFSRVFDVSWRAIMNDDLGEIRRAPEKMGGAAKRWLDKFVSSLYDNATTQAALNGLGTTYKGTGRLTIPNLTIGVNAMSGRTDAKGNKIAFQKLWLVIPSVSRVAASQILKDVLPNGGPNSNVLSDFLAGVAVDPYMDTAGANIPWYLIGDPSGIVTIPLLRMQGVTGPIVARKIPDQQVVSGSAPAAFAMGDFLTGDILYSVTDIVGGNNGTYGGVVEPNGIYYSDGTTA